MKTIRKINIELIVQGRCANGLLAIIEDLCMSSWVPMSLYVLPKIFSKGFMKKNTPIGGHDGGNVEIVGKCECS